MRRTLTIAAGIVGLALLSALAAAQQATPTLESVLAKMDDAAAHFQSAQADFVFQEYQRVVDETDTQKGTVYYRKNGKQIEMMADFKEPDRKFVLYKDGKLEVYQPKIEQVMEYSTANNRDQVESFPGSRIRRQRTGVEEILRRDLSRAKRRSTTSPRPSCN